MEYYINVKFGVSNKTYYFATDDLTLEIGQKVVVETVVGLELAEVTTFPKLISSLNYDKEIKPIKGRATEEDLKAYKANEELAIHASELFTKAIADLKLDMRLIGAQYTLDRAKILFTYVADDRVDFRELLKVLAAQLHCRIELRQINSRERAQLVGGLGVCGLPLCCTTFFTQFEGVSLSKAKNQMLAINIPKLSGQCGKLMCCLKYEDDLYTEAKKEFPAINTKVVYEGKEYKVNSFNILSKIVKIANEDDVEFLPLEKINALLNKSESVDNKFSSKGLVRDKILYENKPSTTSTKKDSSKENTNKQKLENSSNSKPSIQKEKQISQKQNKDNNKSQKDNNKQQNNSKNFNKNKSFQQKKPANQGNNANNNQNKFEDSHTLFAGQANKVKAYQEQYYKNNPQEKNQSNKKDNFKPKQKINNKDNQKSKPQPSKEHK